MKQNKSNAEPVTIEAIKFLLENMRIEFREEFRKYRDENMSRFDDVMGQFEIIREDNTIGVHQTSELRKDVDNHEKRIRKLEQS